MSASGGGIARGFGEALRHPKKFVFTAVFALVLVLVLIYGYKVSGRRGSVKYAENLDELAVEVNGVELTFRDLAFYVVYEEAEMQKQALVYNEDDPTQYWKIHTDGVFLKNTARDACMNMAIHDEIFYKMAMAEGIELTSEEKKYLSNSQMDFWLDMCDYDKQESIGVTKQDIFVAMEKAAIAQKYQVLYSSIQGISGNSYNFDGDAFQSLLEENKYKVNEKLWKRIDIGYITVNN